MIWRGTEAQDGGGLSAVPLESCRPRERSPRHEVPWRDNWNGTGYHGYWAQDFYRIDAHLGTPEDLHGLADTFLPKIERYMNGCRR